MIPENLLQLIQQGESQTVEFKKTTALMREAIETACAFSNADGGYIIFGIGDNGEIIGQDVSDATLKNIANAIKLNTDPKIYPEIRKFSFEGKDCIVVIVTESPLKPHLAFGRPYIRVGSVNHRMDRENYELMLQKRFNGYGFDFLIRKDANIQDIDSAALYDFLETANAVRSFNENLLLPVEVLLQKLDLIKEGHLTNAALLLFGKNSQKHLQGHFEIKCGYFADDVEYKSLINDKEFGSNLISNFRFAFAFLLDSLKTRSERNGIFRSDELEFPQSVLRESLVNMIVHRDYRQDIKSTIEVRPSKIVFYNPAHIFKPEITIESLSRPHPSRPGNKLIAKVFYMLGLFENWGSGTLHIINETTQSGKPKPEFSFQDGMFRLELKR